MMLLPRKPLFPGQYEVDQLGKIFEVSFVINWDDFYDFDTDESLVMFVDIIVTTRSALLQTDSLEPAAVLAASKSEKLTLNIFPDLEVNKDVHVTRLILMPHLLNKIELQEFVVDDLEKSFDNNKVQHENLGETICSDRN